MIDVTIQMDAMGNLQIWKGKVQPHRVAKYVWSLTEESATCLFKITHKNRPFSIAYPKASSGSQQRLALLPFLNLNKFKEKP